LVTTTGTPTTAMIGQNCYQYRHGGDDHCRHYHEAYSCNTDTEVNSNNNYHQKMVVRTDGARTSAAVTRLDVNHRKRSGL